MHPAAIFWTPHLSMLYKQGMNGELLRREVALAPCLLHGEHPELCCKPSTMRKHRLRVARVTLNVASIRRRIASRRSREQRKRDEDLEKGAGGGRAQTRPE